ncbi:MAG TPA: hypothetical protein DEQ03_14310 [Marinilabiliales bacterium]|nr:hypothetical protein [Marinilabiliales bacterium]
MINSIGTHIKVKNFQKSKTFYLSLGFKPIFEYGPDCQVKEDYSGIVFEAGGGVLEIAGGHRAVKAATFQEKINSSKISLMIKVDSLETIKKFCQENQIEIAVTPRHYYWNTLEMVVKDPDGTVLVFVAPFTPESAKVLDVDETFATKP